MTALLIACTAPADSGVPATTLDTAPATDDVPAFTPGPLSAAPVTHRRTIVIGAGPAGMAAAMDLAGEVVLVEATDTLGGRGLWSGGVFFFPTSAELRAAGIDLTPSALLDDWEQLTGAPPTAATAAWLDAAESVHDRLAELGVVWSIRQPDPVLNRWWAHSAAEGGVGLTEVLVAALPASVDVRLNTRVTGLRFEGGHVAGVETEAGAIPADTVVMATGGFVNRLDLIDATVEDAAGTFEIGTDPFAQGDAIDWAARFGLGTANLDAIGWSAGLVATPGADGSPIRIETGTITPWFWVDATGTRFVDESQGWSVLPPGIERRRSNVWAVGSWERWRASVETEEDRTALDAAREAGVVIRCDQDPTVLAGLLEVDAAGLVATFDQVAQIAAGTLTDPLFRTGASFATEPSTVCAHRVGHQAMKGFGGVAVNGDGAVLDVDGQVVPGLWSVGEAAGMAVPGMGGAAGWDGSLSAVVWSGWRTAAAINAAP